MNIQPNLKNSTAVICKNCKGEIFDEHVHLRKISKLFTGGAKDDFASIPILKCINCGEILMEMLPNNLKINEGENLKDTADDQC